MLTSEAISRECKFGSIDACTNRLHTSASFNGYIIVWFPCEVAHVRISTGTQCFVAGLTDTMVYSKYVQSLFNTTTQHKHY